MDDSRGEMEFFEEGGAEGGRDWLQIVKYDVVLIISEMNWR